MKIWSRDFTRFEKILLLVLSLLLVGLVYYQFIDRPVRQAIASSKAECESIESELTVVTAQADHLEQLKNEMDDIKSSGMTSYMGSYNNSGPELAMLNDVLSDTQQYTITFANVTRSNDQIRRDFSLQFRTGDYFSMRNIIERLCESEYRCLITQMRCTTTYNEKEQYVTANLIATFYETMVGGKPDAGLPEDTAAAESASQ